MIFSLHMQNETNVSKEKPQKVKHNRRYFSKYFLCQFDIMTKTKRYMNKPFQNIAALN